MNDQINPHVAQMNEPVQKEQENNFTYEVLSIIWNARRFIFYMMLFTLFLGILYYIIATPMYRSTITLYSSSDYNPNSPMAAMAMQLRIVDSQLRESNYNIQDVVKSRTLSEQIVAHKWKIEDFDKEVTLVEYFDLLWGVEKPDDVITKYDEERWNQRQFYLYSKMMARDRIDVNSNFKTGLITVSVDMENSKLSSDVANFISLFVANLVNNTQKDRIKRNLEFINGRTSVLEEELQQSENELKKFRETNRNILNSPDLQLELQRLQRQVLIKQEVYLEMVKQREVNQIAENKSSDVVLILDKAIEEIKAVKPDIIKIALLTLFVGVFFSGLGIYISSYLSRKHNSIFTRFKILNLIKKSINVV